VDAEAAHTAAKEITDAGDRAVAVAAAVGSAEAAQALVDELPARAVADRLSAVAMALGAEPPISMFCIVLALRLFRLRKPEEPDRLSSDRVTVIRPLPGNARCTAAWWSGSGTRCQGGSEPWVSLF